MKWQRHKILSEEDMNLLAGTKVMGDIQSNRLIVKYESDYEHPSYEELGLFETNGLVYPAYKQSGRRKDTLEILFENEEDIDAVEQHLTQYKIGKD